MSYVDAGYVIALSVLFLYATSLLLRRRRLGRSAGLAHPEPPPAPRDEVGQARAAPPAAGAAGT